MKLPRPSYLPRRSRTVHSEILNDEVCIYEWTSKRVHALNATAARVWNLCDGTRSVAEIAETLRGDIGIHADDVVGVAVDQFSEAGLLDGEAPAEAVVPSRRTALKRLGLTAAMLPIVSSIAAPSALEAASGNSQVFTFTGASQTFVVPAGVTQITVDANGARGGGFAFVAPGGRVVATIPVTAGETLIVNVGGEGGVNGQPGFNGGGQGGAGVNGAGGGGASDVRRGSTRVVVAGAGGGSGGLRRDAGEGGGTTGIAGFSSGANAPGSGGGGSQIAGGAGGAAGAGGTSRNRRRVSRRWKWRAPAAPDMLAVAGVVGHFGGGAGGGGTETSRISVVVAAAGRRTQTPRRQT